MGLSASQARLLSITQRLSNNELQSEIIANNKIRLSEANVAARDKYIQSLDSTQMDYISYDDNGIQESVALTFNAMTQYTPLKNQYNLYNSEGQILVNPQDAQNFKTSNTLYEFLNCYGLFDRGADEYERTRAEYEAQMEEYEAKKEKYREDLVRFQAEEEAYRAELEEYTRKSDEHAAEQTEYDRQYQEYLNALNAPKVYDIFSGIVGTSDAPLSCYNNALRNPMDNDCYKHILGYLINPSTGGAIYTTSAKDRVTVSADDVNGSTLSGDGKGAQLEAVRNAMLEIDPATGEYAHLCDKDDDLNTTGSQNILQAKIDAGETPTKLEILMSDFIYDEDTDTATEVKSLFQKAVDMMYIIKNKETFSELTDNIMKNLLINFTDGDMKNLNTEPPIPPEPLEEFTLTPPQRNFSEPTEPTEPVYIQKLYDQPLAQWYINLWNAMDGSDKSDKLSSISDESANFSYYTVPDKARTSTFDANGNQVNQFYKIIDKNLAGDAEWLQFAITNGIVTLKQAAVRFNGDITWEGVEFSSTSDIREVEASGKIAKAEAEYKKSMYEIQAQDKEYDIKMKKLDTEHSALKSEVDSIKNVMSKNIEKSFNLFS